MALTGCFGWPLPCLASSIPVNEVEESQAKCSPKVSLVMAPRIILLNLPSFTTALPLGMVRTSQFKTHIPNVFSAYNQPMI